MPQVASTFKNSMKLTSQNEMFRYYLTKYIQDLYEENYKTLMNKIKEELSKQRDSPCSWIGRQYCQDASSSQLDV